MTHRAKQRLREDSDPADSRNDLREVLQTLADQIWEEAGQPREIAPPAAQGW
jgi:hypothetical protein